MNSVNLLPGHLRPRVAAGARQNGAYVALGVLGLLLIAVTVYVLSLNVITSNENELAELKARKTEADQRAGALSSFGDFQQVKATRVASVKSLADARLDWERLLREISKVLPDGVWLTALEGSTGATGEAAVAGQAPGPSLTVSGCAARQETVATTLLRLRQLNLAVDVSLDESARPEPFESAAASAAPAPTTTGAGQDCGDGYTFSATVALANVPPVTEESRRAPVALGGGS